MSRQGKGNVITSGLSSSIWKHTADLMDITNKYWYLNIFIMSVYTAGAVFTPSYDLLYWMPLNRIHWRVWLAICTWGNIIICIVISPDFLWSLLAGFNHIVLGYSDGSKTWNMRNKNNINIPLYNVATRKQRDQIVQPKSFLRYHKTLPSLRFRHTELRDQPIRCQVRWHGAITSWWILFDRTTM